MRNNEEKCCENCGNLCPTGEETTYVKRIHARWCWVDMFRQMIISGVTVRSGGNHDSKQL